MDIRTALLATTALTSALASVSSTATAATTTFVNSYSSIAAPSSIDGAFDISSFLSAEATAGQNVKLDSATVQIYGYSPPSNSYSQTYAGSYVAGYAEAEGSYTYYFYYNCGWNGCDEGQYTNYYYYYYAVYGTAYDANQGDFQVDTVLVDFGDQQLGASDAQPNTYAYANNYYYSYYTTIGNNSGTVSNSVALDGTGLADLVDNSVLDYVLNTQLGQFQNLNVQLDLTYTATATPLPASLPLFASGLGAIGLLGWRRRRKRTPIDAT